MLSKKKKITKLFTYLRTIEKKKKKKKRTKSQNTIFVELCQFITGHNKIN